MFTTLECAQFTALLYSPNFRQMSFRRHEKRPPTPMRSFVLVACLACAGAFSLTAAPQSTRVVVAASSAEVVMVCKLTLTHA